MQVSFHGPLGLASLLLALSVEAQTAPMPPSGVLTLTTAATAPARETCAVDRGASPQRRPRPRI